MIIIMIVIIAIVIIIEPRQQLNLLEGQRVPQPNNAVTKECRICCTLSNPDRNGRVEGETVSQQYLKIGG